MKAVLFLTIFSLNLALTAEAQTTRSRPADRQYSPLFTEVEEPPTFPGGNSGLKDFIRQNLRYPEEALKNRVQGKVFVTFIVTDDGSIDQVDFLKGPGYGTTEEAMRLIKSMPKWKPGKQSGHPVHVKYSMVVPFELPQ